MKTTKISFSCKDKEKQRKYYDQHTNEIEGLRSGEVVNVKRWKTRACKSTRKSR